jgi:hypothetical protein
MADMQHTSQQSGPMYPISHCHGSDDHLHKKDHPQIAQFALSGWTHNAQASDENPVFVPNHLQIGYKNKYTTSICKQFNESVSTFSCPRSRRPLGSIT